jgi:DNA-binding MarR family transcriptional regulator
VLTREQERRALALASKDYSREQIAADLGVAPSTVSRMLSRIAKRSLADALEMQERLREAQTIQLTYAFHEALSAWEASCGEQGQEAFQQFCKTLRAALPAPEMHEALEQALEATKELFLAHGIGNPRYLEQARAALTDLRKLWGVDTPPAKLPDVPKPGIGLLADFYQLMQTSVLSLQSSEKERGPEQPASPAED